MDIFQSLWAGAIVGLLIIIYWRLGELGHAR